MKINNTWELVNRLWVELLDSDTGLALQNPVNVILKTSAPTTLKWTARMDIKTEQEFDVSEESMSELLKLSVESTRRDLKTTNILLLSRKRSQPTEDADGELSIKKRSKKKTCVSTASLAFQMEPSAVARRNERERNRVRMVNDGFSCLRQHIPYFPDKKKLSKVETLRCAVAYIKHLQDLITEHDSSSAESLANSENECKNITTWVTGQTRWKDFEVSCIFWQLLRSYYYQNCTCF